MKEEDIRRSYGCKACKDGVLVGTTGVILLLALDVLEMMAEERSLDRVL